MADIFASCGKYTYCFEKPMSVYRIGIAGSWSSLHIVIFNAYKNKEKKELYQQKKM